MSINSAFLPRGNTQAVITSGTTLTPLSQDVSFASPPSSQPAAIASGVDVCPPNARVFNASAGIVYISFTTVPRVAVIPAAGAPSLEMPVGPNEDIVFVLPQQPQVANDPTRPARLSINTIAVGTSALIQVTFGEGL